MHLDGSGAVINDAAAQWIAISPSLPPDIPGGAGNATITDAAVFAWQEFIALNCVKRVCIPNRSTKSATRKREQKKRWFRNGQKWRTGCEGRISVIKRRHGLDRSRYQGDDGMKRWVPAGIRLARTPHVTRSCALSSPTSSAAHSRASSIFPASRRARAFATA